MKLEHELKRLEMVSDEKGKTLGILATCTCGWTSGPRFSSFVAQALHIEHLETEERSDGYKR
jgi:hypothetical protein